MSSREPSWRSNLATLMPTMATAVAVLWCSMVGGTLGDHHQPPPPSCPHASEPVKIHRTGTDTGHLYTANASECEAACCGRTDCVAWNWDSNETVNQAPAACQAKGKPYSCCWLRSTVGKLMPGLGCYGTPDCDSWSGTVNRSPPTCPKPSPPAQGERSGCDAGQVY
eukprot:SAG31_NODE_22628_length_521_cov_1.248815_1_plen_166_part_01